MCVQVADFTAFRTRAVQQQQALEAQVADARQDRSAAVAVIEGLQRELREARCECAALVDQRRYFEERALAAATPQVNLHSDSSPGKTAQRAGGPESGLVQDPTGHPSQHQGHHAMHGDAVGMGGAAALDVGPGWVPVQELMDARAQASNARSEAFEAEQRAKGAEEGSREGLRQLREKVCGLLQFYKIILLSRNHSDLHITLWALLSKGDTVKE